MSALLLLIFWVALAYVVLTWTEGSELVKTVLGDYEKGKEVGAGVIGVILTVMSYYGPLAYVFIAALLVMVYQHISEAERDVDHEMVGSSVRVGIGAALVAGALLFFVG